MTCASLKLPFMFITTTTLDPVSVCKYTVHERCVQRAPASCITTYVKSKKGGGGTLLHHWVEGNCYGRCSKCRKRIKSYHGISGLTCRWCHMMVSTGTCGHQCYLMTSAVVATSQHHHHHHHCYRHYSAHLQIHNRCAPSVKAECNLGEHANMIMSPTAICPAVLDRQRSVNVANAKNKVIISIRSAPQMGSHWLMTRSRFYSADCSSTD